MRVQLKFRIFFTLILAYSNICFSANYTYNTSNIQDTKSTEFPLEFNKIVHDFGKFLDNSGSKFYSFKYKNISDKPVIIINISSTCGCTIPEWSKKPISPGEEGEIKVEYSNDLGPYAFDKRLNIYINGQRAPKILRITGTPYKSNNITDKYPVQIGSVRLKKNNMNIGQISQGNKKSTKFELFNNSDKSVKITFTDATPGLKIEFDPNEISSKSIGSIKYIIDTKDKKNWGKTQYKAYIVCDGVKAKEPISFEATILDNFDFLDKELKNKTPMIIAQTSSYKFGVASKNSTIKAEFSLRNTGHSNLIIHKADKTDESIKITYPNSVKPGDHFKIYAEYNTGNKVGEISQTITLITNSATRPLVNLFIIGEVK